jgi:pilus assembly protein CpaC
MHARAIRNRNRPDGPCLGLGLGAIPAGSAGAQTLRIAQGIATQVIQVPMNRAVIVDSDIRFAELSIANPGIADISTLSDRSIYVLGRAPGRTTLTVLGADGTLIANVEVHVSIDIAEFRERLRQILPSEPIEVRTANDGIVLSGTVSSIGRLDAALQLAERYAPDRVSNLMTVGGTQQVALKVRFAEVQRTSRGSWARGSVSVRAAAMRSPGTGWAIRRARWRRGSASAACSSRSCWRPWRRTGWRAPCPSRT